MPESPTTLPPIKTNHTISSFRRLSHHIPAATPTAADVYYCTSPAGVPFLWESQPGTPKIKSSEFPIPPLTPPPSFLSPGFTRRKQTLNKKSLFLRSPLTSCSSSPNRFSFGTPVSKQRRFYGRRPCDSKVEETDDEDDNDELDESPVSSLCFGGVDGRRGGGERRRRWYSSPNIVKLLMGNF